MATPTSQNSATFTNGIVVPTTGVTPGQTGWDGSVCVISAYNTNSSSSAQGYQQSSLTLLPFSDGTDTVAAGSSKTLMLDQTIPDGTGAMLGYNLLIAQPNNLFPVSAVGELASLTTGDFPAITIPGASPQDSSTGINAFVFVQNLQAFPSSNLATEFTTALNSAMSSSSSASIDTTMNAYFASTESYQDVTYSAYLAAQSYLFAFAFAWANFQTSYTYYVYTTGEASGSTETGGTVSELGTITFTQSTQSGIPSLTDPTGGYTITYQPVSGSAITLTFANGQVLTAGGGDVPTICLQGTFMNKSNATGNQSDFGTLIPALAGTVFNQQAIATAYQQDLSSGESGLQKFLNSSGFQLTLDIMTVAMGVKALGEILGWVYGQVSGWWNGGNQPEVPDQQEIEAQEQANVAENQGNLEQADSSADVPDADELPDAQEDLQGEVIANNNGMQQQEIKSELNNEAEQVEAQLELENNEQIQNEAQELRNEEEEVESVNPSDSDAEDQLANLQQENEQLQENIEQENEEIEQSVNEQAAQELEQSAETEQEQVEEEQEEEEQEQQEEENEEDGDDGGFDDDIDLA